MKQFLTFLLLLITWQAHANFPATNPASRPNGWQDPFVEGVRVAVKAGCSYQEFKDELTVQATNTYWPFTIVRHYNKTLSTASIVRYAVVYSFAPKVINVLGAFIPTDNDGDRLNLLRTYKQDDKDYLTSGTALNNMSYKSNVLREGLKAHYIDVFDNSTTCIKFAGFQYKVAAAAVEASAFANSSTSWSLMESNHPLSTEKKNIAPSVAVIDGPVNPDSLYPGLSAKLDFSAPNYIPQTPLNTTDKTASDDTAKHTNSVVNIIGNLSPVKKIYMVPILTGDSFYDGINPDTSVSITTLESAITWVRDNAAAKNIKVVNISAHVPVDSETRYYYDVLNTLRNNGVTVVQAVGNDGLYEADTRRASYTSLANPDGNLNVNGAPNIMVGTIGKNNLLTSNFGNQMVDTVLNTNANNGLIKEVVGTTRVNTNLFAANDTFDLGKTSYGAAHITAEMIYALTKMPWLTPNQLKIALVDSLYYNSPGYDPQFLSQESIDREYVKFAWVRGGLFNAKTVMDYLTLNYPDPAPIVPYTLWYSSQTSLGVAVGPLSTQVLLCADLSGADPYYHFNYVSTTTVCAAYNDSDNARRTDKDQSILPVKHCDTTYKLVSAPPSYQCIRI